MYIPESLHQELYSRVAPRIGDILLAKNGTTGAAAIINEEKIFDIYVSLALIRTVKDINSYFTLYAIRSTYVQTHFFKSLKGIGVPNLHLEHIRHTLIPIPPISEQGRCVSKIEKLIPIIASIQANKENLIETINTTKSKILDLAIRGKLVPQDESDEPASVLLERIQAEKKELIRQGKIKRNKRESVIYRGMDNSYYERFADGSEKCIDEEIPFEIPDSWTWVRLGHIIKNIQYGLSSSAEISGTCHLLRITDIQNGKVDWDTVPYTSTNNLDKYLLHINDILFARTGATVGKSFLVTQLPCDSVYASYLIRVQLLDNIWIQYIHNFFNSNSYWAQIRDKMVGIGQPNCNGTSLKELLIPFPPLLEQKRITLCMKDLINKINSMIDYIS